MDHDVFISYSEADKETADRVCSALEAEGVKCWIAPRDIDPGMPWSEAIIDAINQCPVFVLIFSFHSNDSEQVIREVQNAVHKKKRLIPFRTENVTPSKAMEYFIGVSHWLDAFLPPLDGHLVALVRSVQSKLNPAMPDAPVDKPKPAAKRWDRRKSAAATIAAIFLVAAALLAIYFIREKTASDSSSFPGEREYKTNRDSFLGAMPWLRWILYDPTEYDPYKNKEASEASIRKDLQALRQHGFNGLITITSKGTCSQIARIAHEEGFQKVIVGVREIRDNNEINNALQIAQYADAYCLGHRGLKGLYSFGELENARKLFIDETLRPVTTSELVVDYELNPGLVAVSDFLFPDVHSNWHKGQSPQAAWAETLASARKAAQLAGSAKPVLLKMVSFPSGGAAGLTTQTQVEFYRLAAEEFTDRNDVPSTVSLSFMTAFDPVWKTEEYEWSRSEQYTGLFTAGRKPKPAVTEVKWRKMP